MPHGDTDLGQNSYSHWLVAWWNQAISWTKAHLLAIGPLGANFDEFWIKIHSFLFMNILSKMLSATHGNIV